MKLSKKTEKIITIPEYYKWLKREWAKVGFIVGLFLFAFLIVAVRPHDYILFILLLQTPLYMMHQSEEWVFSGGFGTYFNRYILKLPDNVNPLDEIFIFRINIGLVWLAFPIFGLLSSIDYAYGMWIPYFVIIAGVYHIGIAIKTQKLYNPGLIVSLLLNIPVGSWAVYELLNNGLLDNYILNVHALIGLILNLALPVLGYFAYKKGLRNM
ncbi:MAG: hypothetical protein ACI9GM_001057 [Salibacteraceae bacterium]|jgi:hypothetical protein